MVLLEQKRRAEQGKKVQFALSLLVLKLDAAFTGDYTCARVQFLAVLLAILESEIVQTGEFRLEAVVLGQDRLKQSIFDVTRQPEKQRTEAHLPD